LWRRLCGGVGGLIERASQAAGVERPVLRIEAGEHIAGALVDEVDGTQVPGCVAHLDAGGMPVAIGHLEAPALDDNAAVALLLRAMCAPGEGETQPIAVGAGARDRRSFEEAGERCGADLGVARAVVLVLAPGLRGLIEEGEGEVGNVLQHGDQPAFDRPPERLLLGVLVRTIRKRRVVQDTEARQALADLCGGHGGAVVAQGRARQATLLERLGQAVRDRLRRLGEIPLQVTGEARAIVEHAEQDRRDPLAARSDDLA
jgi:hypothetical protein